MLQLATMIISMLKINITLNFLMKGLKTSQASMLKHYNIPHDPKKLHDALYDIEMTFQIFLKQIYDIEV